MLHGQYREDWKRQKLSLLQVTQEGEENYTSLEKGSFVFCLHFIWNLYSIVLVYEATNFYTEDIE